MQLSAFVPFAQHLAEQRVRLVFVGSGTSEQAERYLSGLKLEQLRKPSSPNSAANCRTHIIRTVHPALFESKCPFLHVHG